MPARSELVAAITRTSTRTGRPSPTRSNSRSCSTRSSLACRPALIVPTSSRKNVPLWACSSRPCRLPTAPVNAPRTWPNSSASSSDSGMAPQLSATNRSRRRGLLWWMALATSSLPVPVSPVISTVLLEAATVSSRANSRRIGALRPTMPSKR